MIKNENNGIRRIIAYTQQMLAARAKVIVALDGRCASGKTFFAEKLCRMFNASCIHCDDFFLPKSMRSEKRLSEPFGNIHYERLAETLQKARGERDFRYIKYDCFSDTFTETAFVNTAVVVVEGSYSLNDLCRQYYDVKAFLTVNKTEQLQRLLERNPAKYGDFVNKWIPLEEKYFSYLDMTDVITADTSGE